MRASGKEEVVGMRMRRWIWLYLWILSLAVISCYGGAVSYGIFFGVTLVPVISLIYLAAVFFQLRILQQVESRNMVCGQPMPYFFVLQNDACFVFASIGVRLFSSFSYVEELPGDVEYELLPGDKYRFETMLACKYRGEYEVGVKEIIITDLFRLFRIHYRIPGTIKAIVLPKVTRIEKLHSIDNLSAVARRETQESHTEPDCAVRDYVKGDPVKQIHWKATAREQKLKVRGRVGEEKQGISLLWDTRRGSGNEKEYLPIENKILEAVLALGIYMAERNAAFTAFYGQNGMAWEYVEGINGFDAFYKKVSGVIFDERENFEEVLSEAMKQRAFLQSQVVFCVVSGMSEGIMRLAGQLDKAGTIIVLYVVTDENIEDYVKQSNERKRIIALPVEAGLEGGL